MQPVQTINKQLTEKWVVPGRDAIAPNLMAFMDEQGWNYKLLGRAEMPEQITRLHGWTIVPADLDASEIPDAALDKVRLMLAQGYRPKGFVLIHEVEEDQLSQMDITTPRIDWFEDGNNQAQRDWGVSLSSVIETAKPIVGAATKVIKGALVLTGLATAALVVGSVTVVGALLDPVLVVVTDDNYWIEIDRWWA